MHDLDRSIIYLMRYIVLSVESAVNKQAVAHGLRIEEIWVLFRVLANENQTVGELADETGIEKSTLSRVLTRMEASRLIIKHRARENQRTVRIKLTERGRVLARARHPTFRDFEALVVQGLAASDVRNLKNALVRMMQNARSIGEAEQRDLEKPALKPRAKRLVES